jgi:hypothetical protein
MLMVRASPYHTRLVRTAPLRCNGSIKGSLDHPLLRIADVKYRNSPLEGKIVCGLLEDLCVKQGITSEREGLARDLHLGQWVREGIDFGQWLLENKPAVFDEMFQSPSGCTGAALVNFFERRLSSVKDWTDPLDVTLALLEWQAEYRGAMVSRYYGEQLETIVNCIDAAIYIPWALSKLPVSREGTR